jgi:hypothetical protein
MGVCPLRLDAQHFRTCEQQDTRAKRAFQLAADEFKRMVCAVAGNESAQERCVDTEFLPHFATRPYLDALAVLRGKRYLIANSLLFSFVGREMQPPPRRKIARNPLTQNGLFQKITIAKRQA